MHYPRDNNYLKCTFLTLLSHTGQTDLTTVIMREIKQYLSCGAQSCLNTDSREFIKIQMMCRNFFMVVLFLAKKSFCIPSLLDFFTCGLMKHPQLLVLFPIYVHRFLFMQQRTLRVTWALTARFTQDRGQDRLGLRGNYPLL